MLGAGHYLALCIESNDRFHHVEFGGQLHARYQLVRQFVVDCRATLVGVLRKRHAGRVGDGPSHAIFSTGMALFKRRAWVWCIAKRWFLCESGERRRLHVECGQNQS